MADNNIKQINEEMKQLRQTQKELQNSYAQMNENKMLKSDKIDFIGDIHGNFELLVKLLRKLGYETKTVNNDEIFYHPNGRMVIFIGDYIDRGPQTKECLDVVSKMVSSGNALALIGNHEFNYLAYKTKSLKSNEYLREHNDDNRRQVEATLKSLESNDYLDWIKDLPLFIRTSKFKAIHAHWHEDYISYLEEIGNSVSELGNYFFHQANKKGTSEYEVIDDILKGPEYQLPKGKYLLDSDGKKRTMKRIEWWIKEEHSIPIFYGHYSSDSEPYLISEKICCLDFGKFHKTRYLTAYRWSGEAILEESNLVWVK